MDYIIIIVFILQTTSSLPAENCPTSCKCGASRIECRNVIPNFINSNIRSVIVHEVKLPNSIDFSDPGWTNVTYLAINPGSSALGTPFERQISLHENEFKSLKNLEYLQITCSCLQHVSTFAFQGLDKLKVLVLSNNVLTPDSFFNALGGETNLPSLEELYLSNTDTTYGGVFAIDTDFLNVVRNKSLKVLDISRTSYAFPRRDMDLFHALSSLEKLNMSKAGVAMMVFSESFIYFNLLFPGFPSLKSLDISYPPPSHQIARITFGDHPDVGRTYVQVAKQLKEFYCRNIFTLQTEISYVYHNSSRALTCGLVLSEDSQRFEYCIVEEFNLEKVDLAENMLLYFDPNILKKMTSLKFIDISNNKFGDAFSKEGYVQSTVANLYRLEILIVSNNGIFSIPADAFEGGHKLRILDLSNNKLETVAFKTDNLVSLRRLNLSNNKISVLDGTSLERISHLKLQKVNGTFLEHRKIEIDLNGNPINCVCENRQYFTWVLTQNETASCLLNEKESQIDEYILKNAEFLCKRMYVIAVYLALSITEVIVTISFAINVIKERRAILHNKNIRAGIQEYTENRMNKRNPPVFLSFCSEDDEIVMTDVAPNLETGLKALLQTDFKCVATGYNDFRPGFSLANEIIRCVEEASVVVFFVTNDFCKKEWCRNEALVAHYENKPIILMIWEELDLRRMPRYMFHHYQEHTRVHWVQENGERVMKPNMDKLCEAIVSLFKDK